MNDNRRSSAYRVSAVRVAGQRYEADVPDTLDLARRAALAVNALTREIVPERWYSVWQGMNLDSNPPHFAWPNWLTYKYLEALPRMRQMSGSELNLDVERAMMQTFVDHVGEHGLLYYPAVSPDQPPRAAYGLGCARMMLAMVAWHERDGDPGWLDLIRDMARGLGRMAIRHFDYAYFPLESGYGADGSWHFTQRGAGRADYFPYAPPDEPSREQQGHEGTVKFDMATPICALVKCYRLTGDEQSLELAKRLPAFCRLPSMWEDGWEYGIAGHEPGLFAGHFHGNTMALRGLLDLALVTGDQKLKGIVQEAYEHGCRCGLRRLGWVPGWITPERFGRLGGMGAWLRSISESCALGDMAELAVRLSDAGIGDYWDDLDHLARNQLVGQQFVDAERMQAVAEFARANKPRQELNTDLHELMARDTENVIERMVGAFGMGSPTIMKPVGAYGCCTGNGSLGLYYAWESIVRCHEGSATMNLLLNRASKWVDVDSYLPYEGRVRLTNKTARSIAVRIPHWVSIEQVAVTLDASTISPLRVGRYLTVGGLRPGQVIDLRFDVPQEQANYICNSYPYRSTFRGSTVVDVSPRDETLDPSLAHIGAASLRQASYPLYQREHLKGDGAPVTQQERFVSEW